MSEAKIDLSRLDLNRFKRNAKRSSKRSGQPYCTVLNDDARRYGFETFESLRVEVESRRSTSFRAEAVDPELEALLAWFRSRFTRVEEVGERVPERIVRSLRLFHETTGRSPYPQVDVGDEIDFGYRRSAFQLYRHPQALVAEELLEAEGPWVPNAWLDSLKIRQGGFLGDGPDDVVGYRISFALAND